MQEEEAVSLPTLESHGPHCRCIRQGSPEKQHKQDVCMTEGCVLIDFPVHMSDFFLRPPADCIRPTHLVKDNLLY